MASRSRTTFKKRQKELARMEKQRDKAAKRMQRKAEKLTGDTTGSLDGEIPLDGEVTEGIEPSDSSNGPSTESSAV